MTIRPSSPASCRLQTVSYHDAPERDCSAIFRLTCSPMIAGPMASFPEEWLQAGVYACFNKYVNVSGCLLLKAVLIHKAGTGKGRCNTSPCLARSE